MPSWLNKDERAARKAERNREYQAVRDEIAAQLQVAADCAERGDLLDEESAIQVASFIAARHRTFLWDPIKDFAAMVVERTNNGELRRAEYIGHIAQTYLWVDRIVCVDDIKSVDQIANGIHLLDAETRADVMSEGELRTTKRPTLTRMAVGSVLPGTALIPGFAFQKKETQDDRRLFFTLEQQHWGKIIELDPEKVDVAILRNIAMKVRQASATHAKAVGQVPHSEEPQDPVSQIGRLAELRDSGAITDAEFEAKKTQLLEEI